MASRTRRCAIRLTNDASRSSPSGCASSLDRFEELLEGRDHLFGDEFSAADCAAFPFLKYGLLRDPADDELFHLILEEHLALNDEHPRLRDWIARVNQRPRA